jgi:hypothetical protein
MVDELKNTWIIQSPDHKLIGLLCGNCGKPFERYDRIKSGAREHFKCRSPQYQVEKPNVKPYRPRQGDIVRYGGRKQLVLHDKRRDKVLLVSVRKNGRTGKWIRVRRSYWYPTQSVRDQAKLIDKDRSSLRKPKKSGRKP